MSTHRLPWCVRNVLPISWRITIDDWCRKRGRWEERFLTGEDCCPCCGDSLASCWGEEAATDA